MGEEQELGYFQDDFDPANYVPPDPTMPSEMGGTMGDWGTPEFDPGAVDYSQYGDIAGSGGYGTEAGYMDPGSALAFPSLAQLGQMGGELGGLLGLGGAEPSLPPSEGGDLFPGGGMGDLDFSAAGFPAVRGVPWGSMTRQVRTAARIFGPAMLLPIVNIVAQYWTQRLQRLGLQISISPSALVLKVLSKRARRGSRGITGRQLSITARTIGKVERMHQRIRQVCGRAGAHRARAPAYAFHRRRKR